MATAQPNLEELKAKGDAQALVAALRFQPPAEAADRAYLAAVRAALASLGEAAVPVLAGALGDPDARVSANAARVLGSVGTAAAAQALLASLGRPNAGLRAAAAAALGLAATTAWKRGETPAGWGAVALLLGALADPDAALREAAAGALGRFGDPAAAEPLVGLLKDPSPAVRAAAAVALGGGTAPTRVGGPAAVEPLTACLKDQDVSVRMSAVMALGEIGDVRAEAAISAVAGSDPNDGVRRAAHGALLKLLKTS